MAEEEEPSSLLSECFSVAWGIACRDGVIDSAFWAHVRLCAIARHLSPLSPTLAAVPG